MSDKVYGIDLGTTYSCIAGFDEFGKVVVFENDIMETTTPSVVWFHDKNKATIGALAKEQAAVEPKAVVSAIKREMGSNYTITQCEKKLRPEMISALILKKIAKGAGLSLNESKKPKVVITIPAYFGLNERQATENAGKMAGLDVLSLIDEPSAAAISYGMEQEKLDGKTVLVFDLGGGTFDATIINVGCEIKTIAVEGDSRLGGRDWDKKIAEYFIKRFCEETGYDYQKASKDEIFLEEMIILAEKRKRQLTEITKVKVAIEQYGLSCSFDFTREEFDDETSGLLSLAIDCVHKVIDDAKKKDYTFTTNGMEILMVGGSTLMPQVARKLEKEFNIKPKSYKPHEAVARGATLYARQVLAVNEAKSKNRNVDDLFIGGDVDVSQKAGDLFLDGKFVRVKPATSKSFGIKYVEDEYDKVGFVKNIIFKNTEIPFAPNLDTGDGTSKSYTVRANQEKVLFELYENEDIEKKKKLNIEDDFCSKIGEMYLTLPPNMPKDEACATFMELSEDGLLHAWGIHIATGRRCDVSIETDRILTQSEIEHSALNIVNSFYID